MQNSDNAKPLRYEIMAKMEQYRCLLLAAGMLEPTARKSSEWRWYFYRPATDLTAFVVNLKGADDRIEVTYGYASTAFTRMAGDENALAMWGVADSDVTISEKLVICSEADEANAKARIAQMHARYAHTDKDELLSEARSKRKAFIQHFTAHLKPMGFKKKANAWTLPLEIGYYVMFNAQKSSYSDEYYFNVYIGKDGSNSYGDCYSDRLAYNGEYLVDWQAMSEDELEVFLSRAVVPEIQRIINTPLPELGKQHSVWQKCTCDRRKCERCWVEKNLWEAKGS